MSGIIFVVLAVGWAVYLLPKALKRDDDLDRSRPVEEFSGAVRVLGHGVAQAAAKVAAPAETKAVPAPVMTITREAARRAAKRRRRVLAVLLTALVAVSVTSYLAYTPWYSTAIPAGLVLVFLVVARLTVRAQTAQRRVAPVQQEVAPAAESTEESVEVEVEAVVDVEPDLGNEDTQGLSRDELAAAVAAPVLDEGGLWDPLPVTLPTYVTKARARRTVRTIEITGAAAGITSSGHDAADSALAAEAREAEQAASAAAVEGGVVEKKAAGA